MNIRPTIAAAAAALSVAACATTTVTGARPLAAGDYTAILSDAGRPEADKKDDAARKPAEVLAFAGIRPGDIILEMEVGRGWYTEILSLSADKAAPDFRGAAFGERFKPATTRTTATKSG